MENSLHIGPAYRYFVGQALFSPLALIALAFCLMAFLPINSLGLPGVFSAIQEQMAAWNLRAVGPSLFVVLAAYNYLLMVTTSYRLEDGYITKRTMRPSGILTDSMTISMIVDCNVVSSWAEAAMGLGTLHLRSADHGEPDLYLRGVAGAEDMRRRILERTGLANGRVLGTV